MMNMVPSVPDTDLESLLKAMRTWAQAEEGIIALYLYGSHAEGRANTLSDVDVALLAKPNLSRDQLWRLEDRWAARWPENVDIHVLNLAPLPFRYEVTTRGRRLWTADLALVADWESLTWRRYWDVQPRLEHYWQQYVKRLEEQRNETERQQYQAALAKVRAVHRRVRETAIHYADDLQE